MNPSKITLKITYRPASIHFAYIPKDGCINSWQGCREVFHDLEDEAPDHIKDFEDVKQFAAYLPSPEPDIIFKNVKTIIGIVEKSIKLPKSKRLRLHLIDPLPIGKSKKLKPYAGNQKIMVVDLPKFWRRELQQNLLTALIRAARYIKPTILGIALFNNVQEVNKTNFWDAIERSGYFSGRCNKALERFMAGYTRFTGRHFDGWVDDFYHGGCKKLAKEKNNK